MTRKHFQATAEIIAELKIATERFHIANRFATYFQELSPRFDRGRFLDAVEDARQNLAAYECPSCGNDCAGECHAKTYAHFDY
jgi:hypothetical protein